MDKISQISKELKEPEWLLQWRAGRIEAAGTLPKEIKYGIGITGLLPQEEPDFSQTADYHVDASKGLEVYTWKEAVNQEEIAPIVRGLMESTFFPAPDNSFIAIAEALFHSGLVVYVQPNMNDKNEFVTEKLSLDTKIPTGSSADVILAIVKEGARFEMTSAVSGGGNGSYFARTLVVICEGDASVTVYQKATTEKETLVLRHSRGIVSAHSTCTWNDVFSGPAEERSYTENILVGESARGDITQAVIADNNAKYDITATTKHLASDTTSLIRLAGISAGESKTVYRGFVDIEKGVARVNGAQEAKFLVLSKSAKMDAIPALDIGSSDVRSSHKLSISHIKEGDVFYPKLRGLSDKESKRLFLEGMFAGLFPKEENGEIMSDINARFDALTD